MRFDELHVGQSAALSRQITDAEIRAFAEASGDFNALHFDDAAAAGTPFHGHIAHGMLTASLISAVLGMRLPGAGAIYLQQSLRFVRPVYPGETITATAHVVELLAEKKRARLETICTNERGEIVVTGEAVVAVAGGD